MDHNATTPVRPEILEAMLPFYGPIYGNASSLHGFGREAKDGLERAREQVAKVLGARPDEVCFTGGGTEADNLAVKGMAWANRDRGDHLITSQVEHHAVFNTCEYLEKQGFKVTYLPVDSEGRVDPGDVEKAITKETLLVSIMQANNETGTVQPISEIGRIARKRGIYFHTDAVQAFTKLPTRVDELGVDLLSLSGHKIYGPKGVGCLYIRKGTKLDPLVHGGHHERNRRAGTENVPGIVGLGKAAELGAGEMSEEAKKLATLRDRLQEGILDRIPEVRVNARNAERLPGTLSACFKYVEGESILLGLDLKGIAASSGSACSSGAIEPSHVLTAMGVPPEEARGSVRFSLGRQNTEQEVDRVVGEMVAILTRLRAMSPLRRQDE
jgi:cysteine desulfurase